MGSMSDSAYRKMLEAERIGNETLSRVPLASDLQIDPADLNRYFTQYDLTDAGANGILDNTLSDIKNTEGTSAASGLTDALGHGFDFSGRKGALDSMAYDRALMTGGGHDAVGDAAYAKGRANAEQAARAAREAGMERLNERGQGNGGMAALASLEAARSVGSDANTAALNAAAMAQARRDAAATQLGGTGNTMYGTDVAKGNASNNFGISQAGLVDTAHQKTADQISTIGRDQATNKYNTDVANWGRTNDVNDNNVTVQNNNTAHNKQAIQQAFTDRFNAGNALSANLLGQAQSTPLNPDAMDWISKGVDWGGKIAKGVAGGMSGGAGAASYAGSGS